MVFYGTQADIQKLMGEHILRLLLDSSRWVLG